MKHLIKQLGLAALFAVMATTAQASDTIRFGVAAEPFPPFSTKNPDGKWVGWEIDLMNAVCTEMKTKCELVEVAWDGIIPALQEGKIDVIWSSMSITAERKKVIDFTDKYYSPVAVFVGAKADPIKIDFDKPESLAGKVLGAQTATTHASFAEARFGSAATVKLYDTFDNGVADLTARRLDLLMANGVQIQDFLKSDAGKAYEVKAYAPKDPIFGEGTGGGVRQDDVELKNRLNAAIKAVLKNGEYDQITRNYFDFDIYGG